MVCVVNSKENAILDIVHYRMSMGNIALAVFFGLKNTPLALLSPFSYDGLNLLHLIVGYTAVAQMVFHGICYMKWEDMHQAWSKLLEPENWGNRCGICHVGSHDGVPQTFWIRDLLHQPHHRLHPNTCFRGIARTLLGREDLHSKSIYRLHLDHRPLDPGMEIFNFVDNRATLHALPNGGVKLISTKQLAWAAPGSHCFVWIPSVRPFETHPFTIVSNTSSGLELIMKSHSGFTKAAYEYAVSKPGASVRVSFDGPYGSFPDLACYDRIVLIAGGSGATFTMGLACTILESLGPDSAQFVDFIWAVKTKGMNGWPHFS